MNQTRRPRIVPILCAVLGLTGASLFGQIPAPPSPEREMITLEVWAIDDTIIHGDQPPEDRMLREAQYILGGMIYGWDFVWVPAVPARGVERFFELTPLGEIQWGDPRLEIRDLADLRRENNTVYGQIDFFLSPTDRGRLRAWNGLSVERGAGIGTAPIQQGLPGKERAIEAAVHRGIRDYMRGATFNPPREVRGSVMLEQQPQIRPVSGTYEARAHLVIRIDEVIEYRVF